jgi:outer membrane protein assembly factor BamB
MDAANGKILWTVEGETHFSGSPVAGEGCLVLGGNQIGRDADSQGGLTCFKLNDDVTQPPTKVWSLPKKYGTDAFCTPVIYRGHIYTRMTGDDAVKPANKMFVCVELTTGKILGRIGFHADCRGSMTAGDGLVFYEGFALRADPKRFEVHPGGARFGASDGSKTWANCVTATYVEGRLFLRGRNYVHCLDIRACP